MAVDWVDPLCDDYAKSNLLFCQNSIISKKGVCYVFGKQRLNENCSFTVIIDDIKEYVGLGIIDTLYKPKTKLAGL